MKKKIDSQSQINKILNRNLTFVEKFCDSCKKKLLITNIEFSNEYRFFFFKKNVTNIEVDKCREQI